MDDETIKLILDMGRSGANVKEVAQELARLDAAAHKAATGADELAGSTRNLGRGAGLSAQGMLDLGRSIQDFSAAGIGGITNNIEGLARGLGYGAGIAGVATIAAVGLQVLMPQIKGLAGSLLGGDKAAEGMASATEKLSEAAEKLRTKLAELKAEGTARLQQMEAENAALDRQVKLEEQRAANRSRHEKEETERRARAVAMEGAPSLEEQRKQPTEKRRADELKKLIGGDPEATLIRARAEAASAPTSSQEIEAIARALREEMARVEKSGGSFAPQVHRRLRADLKALEAGASAGLTANQVAGNLSPQSQALVTAARRRAAAPGHERADELLGRFYAGDAAAVSQVVGMLPEGTLRENLHELTPEGHRARIGRNVGQTLEGFGRRVRDKAAGAARERSEKDARESADAAARAAREAADEAVGLAVGKPTPAERAEPGVKAGDVGGPAADRMLQEQIRFGRKAGEAAEKAAPKGMPAAEKVPLLEADATEAELARAMLANQQQLTTNVAQLQRQLDEARRVGQANRRIGQQIRQPQVDPGVF